MTPVVRSPDSLDSPESPWPADPRDAAAWWFARSRSGRFEPEEAARLEHWRRLDPRHEAEWQALDFLWRASARVPREEWSAMLQVAQQQEQDQRQAQVAAARPGPATSGRTGWAPRRYWRPGWALAAAVLLLTAGVAWQATTPGYVTELATARGDVRTLALPDGSVLTLNTDSRATVRYYRGRRTVELIAGEAYFEVTRRDGKAFEVDAGEARVMVTGTAFSVRREPDKVGVAVQTGSVDVRRGPWWRLWASPTRLGANQGASLAAGQWSSATAVDVDRLTTWRQGKLIFSNQRLAQVVEEMNRYLPQPIRVHDPALGARRVSGIFNLDSADDFQKAVQATLPVIFEPRPDGGLDLLPR